MNTNAGRLFLTHLREKKGWSKLKLAQQAALAPAQITMFESSRMVPYPIQAKRLAEALEYNGNPEDLFKPEWEPEE